MALSNTASEVDLTAAYGRFRDEAVAVSADYAPETVNTDGWKATQAAWRTLFPKVVLILCFLHGFMKIRDRGRTAFELHGQIWEVYQAANTPAFREAMESFRQWCTVRAGRVRFRKRWKSSGVGPRSIFSVAHPGFQAAT